MKKLALQKEDLICSEFDEKSLCLWVRITPRHLAEFGSELPSEFIGHARLRMAALKGEGCFDGFVVYDDRFEKVCQKLKKHPVKSQLKFIIAAGFPDLKGVQVHKVMVQNRPSVTLSLKTPASDMQSWQPHWLVVYIQNELLAKGLRVTVVSEPEIQAIWILAAFFGQEMDNQKLTLVEALTTEENDSPYQIRVMRQFNFLILKLHEVKRYFSESKRTSLISEAVGRTRAWATKPGGSGYYVVLPKHMQRAIMDCQENVQLLDIETPLRILAGLVLPFNIFSANLPCSDIYSAILLSTFYNSNSEKISFEETFLRLVFPAEKNAMQSSYAHVQTHGLIAEHKSESLIAVNYWVCGKDDSGLHQEGHRVACLALDTLAGREREVQALTLNINESILPNLMHKIDEFRQRLFRDNKIENPSANITQLSWQFYPLTLHRPDYDKHKNSVDGLTYDGPWLSIAIRELTGLDNFHEDPDWIAAKLVAPVTADQVKVNFEKTLALGLIRYNEKLGRYEPTSRNILAREDITGKKVTNYHRDVMNLGFQLLPLVPVSRRDYTLGFVHVLPNEGDRIKASVIEFLENIFKLAGEAKGSDQVFQLNLQMFPVMRGKQ